MNGLSILIAEDEPKTRTFLHQGLIEEGCEVWAVGRGSEVKYFAESQHFDVVLLDVMLPDANGFDLCEHIRSVQPHAVIVMLTALGTLTDKLQGFERGADDYLVKPFEFLELTARIRALRKRISEQSDNDLVLQVDDLVLNKATKEVRRGSTPIKLTAKEFALLEYLMMHRGKVLSRAQIAEHVWDIQFDTGTNVIDVYINFLRKKIDAPFSLKLIQTLVGMGYVLRAQ